MEAIILLLNSVINIYIWVVLGSVILSWLVAFNVVNTHNRFVFVVGDVLHKLTEPVLAPIRRLLPKLGGIDLSPLVLILLLMFLQNLVVRDLAGAVL
jgi:YggT family protein